MNKRYPHEFQRDIEMRQRNIVFPDTLRNETRGWRYLMTSKQPLSVAQLGALSIMFFSLVGLDTTTRGRPSQSLGRVDIVSHRKWKPDDRPRPISETLNFPIPSNSAIRRFDEVTILFRLDGYRARDAAKIGIDHFTLVPRGL